MRSKRWLQKGRTPILLLLVLAMVIVSAACKRSPQARGEAFLETGRKLLEQKEPARAALEFRNAAQVTPRNPEAHYQLGLAYTAMGNGNSAVAAFRKALEVDPKHKEAQLHLAQLMSLVKDPAILKDAQQRLRLLLDEIPENAEAMQTLAITDLKLGKSEEAAELLTRALTIAPENVLIAITMAQTKLQQGDVKGAEEVLKNASSRSPGSADAAYVMGRFYASRKRMTEAESQYQQALAIDGKHENALLSLAALQSQAGRKGEAEQYLKRLYALPGKRLKANYPIFLFQEGRKDEAIREFENLAKADPEDRAARTRLIAAYQGAGRFADAERVLGAALKQNPKDMDALLQRSEVYVGAGKLAEAEKDLTGILAANQDSGQVHYALAQVYKARGVTLRYRQELSDASRLNPGSLPIRLELARALIASDQNGATAALHLLESAPDSTEVLVERNWAYLVLRNFNEMRKGIDRGLARGKSPDLLLQDAVWKIQSGNLRGAQTSLEEALKLNSDSVGALDLLTQTYRAQKQNDLALKKVEEYAAKQTKSAPTQQLLGTALLAKGDRNRARGAFLAAKAADPRFRKADESLIKLDIAEGKMDDATARLKTLLASNPSDATVRLWSGDLELLKRNPTAALEHYRKAVDSDPQNVRALNNLAYLLAQFANQPDEALKHAQKAVEIAPQDPDSADTLGWVLYQKGLYSEAIKQLERAAATKRNVAYQYHLAMAYAKVGQQDRAKTTLNAALKVNAKAPEAEAALKLVGGR